MKKISPFYFVLILLSSFVLNAQLPSSNRSHPQLNIADNHNTVQKSPDNTRIFISGSRSMISSSNGGVNFTTNTVRNFNSQISKTFFTDSIHGWAVGLNGLIVNTTDGGNTWTPQSSGTTENLNGVHFINQNTGWIAGNNGTALYTSNGGVSWNVFNVGSASDMLDVYVVGIGNVWVCGRGGELYQTTNVGSSWNSVSSSTLNDLYDIQFLNASEAWACASNGVIIKTIDGGSNWTNATTSIQVTLYGVHFINSTTGFVCGDGGYIVGTSDGGSIWNNLTFPVGGVVLNSICFTTASKGFAVGNNGLIMVSNDGGANWSDINTRQTISNFKKICAVDNNVIFAGGDNGAMIKTGDGGSSWVNPAVFLSTENVRGISFNSTNTGFFSGDNGTDGIVSVTTNGGLSVATQTVTGFQSCVKAIDANTAISAGEFGYVYLTTNQGSTWTQYFTGSNVQINDIAMGDATTGLVAGANGFASRTVNGGLNWFVVGTGGANTINKIFAVDASTYYVVGANGTIKQTLNAGIAWSTITSPTAFDLTDIYVSNTCVIYLTDINGVIYYTNDGGTSWNSFSSQPDEGINSLSVSNENNVWICGDMAYVSKLNNLAFSGADIQVKGNGNIIPNGSGAIAADSTDFGNVYVGFTKTSHYVIQNNGSDPLYISGITFNGSNPTEFYVSGTIPSSIAPLSSATIAVVYAPSSAGSHSAGINIFSSDCTPTNYSFGLVGNGTNCVLPNVPVISGLVSICAGQSTTLDVSAYNLNGAANWVWYSGSCAGTPEGSGSTIVLSPATTTTYFVRGEGGCVPANSGSCAQQNIVVNIATTTASATSSTICAGQNPGLSGSGASTYTWNPGGLTGANPVVHPTSSTVYTVTGTNGFGCTGTYTVGVTVNPSMDITGNVYYSSGGLNGANMYLIRKGTLSSQYDTVAITTTGAGGAYTFFSAPADNYYVKVIAPTTPPNLNDTYYGNEYLWDSAAVLTHSCATSTNYVDINMIEVTPPSGLCTLSGTVYEGVGFGLKLIQGPVNPVIYTNTIPGVPVKVGKNPGGSLVAIDTTDNGGNWSVGNLPYDTYNVYTDVPGYPMDTFYTVTTSVGNEIINNLIYIADSNSVYIDITLSVIHQSAENENLIKIFPNPSSGILYISPISGTISEFKITDVQGRKIIQLQNIDSKNEIDLRELSNGVYYYQARTEKGKNLSGKIMLTH